MNVVSTFVICALLSPLALLADGEDKISRKFEVQPGGKLVMDVDRGNVTVTSSDSREVSFEVTRKIFKVSQADAEEVFKTHQVSFDQEAGTVSVKAGMEQKILSRSKANHLQVNYNVIVPREYDVDLRTRGGSLTVGDLKGQVLVNTAGGNIKVGQISGPVKGKTAGGSITVARAENVQLHTSGGNIDINEIAGDAAASTSGGSVQINKVGGKATATTSGGNIRIGEVAGDLLAETKGGSIRIKEVNGDLSAKTSAGNIEISQSTKKVEAKTSGGSITAAVSGSAETNLKTSAGNITLYLPKDAPVDLAASANGGTVTCDLDISAAEKKRGSLVGKINGGGNPLVLHTSGGSVRVKKGESLRAERE